MRASSRIVSGVALVAALCALVLPASSVAAPAEGTADIGVTGTVSTAKLLVGQHATFTYTVENNGPDRANVVQLAMTISLRATIASVSAPSGIGCRTKTQTVTCTFPFIEPKGTALVKIDTIAKTPGGLTGAATVVAVETDPNPANQLTNPSADILAPDATPPVDAKIGRLAPITLKTPFDLTWSATDPSGIQSYKVRYRTANPAGGFGAPVLWKTATTDKAGTFSGRAGATYCFSAAATDFAGNVGIFGLETCTTLPLGAGSFARRGPWKIVKSTQFLHGLAVSATTSGSTLSLRGITANHLIVYFTRCPDCGKLEATWRGKVIAKFSTKGSTSYGTAKEIFTSPAVQTGDLVLTIQGKGKHPKQVQIEGIAVGKAPANATP